MGCLNLCYDLVLLTTAVLSIWSPAANEASQSTSTSSRDENSSSSSSSAPRVRWQTDTFGNCSLPCGGGQQYRRTRCVREDLWSPEATIEDVPDVMCPFPMPDISRSCNTHACKGEWKTHPWSLCSMSCGEGVQERNVTCELYPWTDRQLPVSDQECGGHRPDKFRKCYLTNCPRISNLREATILAENYTLFQIRKAGILKVNVGGKVKLLPGQTVMVKCPTRHLSRRRIYWSKENRLIPQEGRVKVTSVGLKIQRSDPKQDRGIYTCMAGDMTATINIQFIRRRNPKLSHYRHWAKKFRRRYRRRFPGQQDEGNPDDDNDKKEENQEGSKTEKVLSYFRNKRQHDQGVNVTHNLSFVTGNWSECSVTCGSRGLRQRKVFCAHISTKFVKMVEDQECFNLGVKKPFATRACAQGPADCPVWRPSPWSKCDPWCSEGIGRKSRFLVCEWEGTGKPAWNACDPNNKPVTRKPCKPSDCPQTCKDSSRKCRRVRQFKMCRFKDFRDKCCYSCRDFHHPNNVFNHLLNSTTR